jgi:hypothetical protein
MSKKTNNTKATKKVAKKSAKDLKAIAAADQENARLDAERAAAPDGMTASERAMATSAADAKPAAAKGKGKKAKADAATGAPTLEPTPAPEALTVALAFDKKDRKWDAAIREGKLEHHVLEQRFDEEDAAKKAGEKWIAAYAKAKDAARRKLLGWKAADAKGQAKDATGANVAETGAKPGAKAKRERKAKAGGKESTRGPSGLDVAAQMLKDAGTPLKCKDMVQQMLDKGLWQTKGATPSATIYAAMIREIAEKGKEARFTKTGRGEFAFNTSAPGSAEGK